MTKIEKAKAIAQANPTLPYATLQQKIMEEVPCSRSTARNAIKAVREPKPPKPTDIPAQPPKLEILEEKPKEPIAPPTEEEKIPSEITRLEPEIPITIEEEIEEKPPEEILVFKQTLRSIHILFLSDKGLLGKKYGNSEEAVIEVSDMTYRALQRRYGTELLERWDIAFIFMGYAGLIINPVLKWRSERAKKKPKEKKTKEKPEHAKPKK